MGAGGWGLTPFFLSSWRIQEDAVLLANDDSSQGGKKEDGWSVRR